jgi:hypothetical protein
MRSSTMILALGTALLPVAAGAQQWRTIESARQLAGNQQTSVSLTFAGGKFDLRPLPGSLLYQMQLHYDEQAADAVHEYDADDHQLTLGLEKAEMGWRALRSMKHEEKGSMEVGINPAVPVDLELTLGGAQANIELGGMRVKSLKMHAGVVGGTVRFSSPNAIEMDEMSIDVGLGGVEFVDLGNANVAEININGGMDGVSLNFGNRVMRDVKINAAVAFGGLKIQVPESVGVTVQADTKLSSFNPQGFTRMNGAWFTPNWNQTSTHVTIVANTAVGSLEVSHSNR